MSFSRWQTTTTRPRTARRHGGRRGPAHWRPARPERWRGVAAGTALLLPFALLSPASLAPAQAATGTVGSGFTVTPSDLAFILKQIKIAEAHARTLTAANPCGTLVGSGPDQIPDRLTAYGLRTVDGSCNNLFPGRETFAAADQPFPRLTTPTFQPADPVPAGFGPAGSTSYAQKKGNVFDAEPRVVSNLIVDQTSTNPAAVAAAGFPVRTQGATGKFPCTTDPDPTTVPPTDGSPAGCVPSHHTLDIPNVTTDVGLSPPYNSWFTFFGQFFDHGVDQTVKSGASVFVPLHDDDPLVTLGPDGKAGTGDEVPPNQRFMVLTRAQNQPGRDGILGDDPATAVDESADDVQNATNTDSPWVDQSQTYTSHASHQVFVREYVLNASGRPVSTGKLLGGLPAGQTYAGSPDGTTGMATWASVKKQAAELLGLRLVDADATNVPMLATDPYGKFIPGPSGLPQYVTKNGLVEGNLASPVPVPADVLHFDTPFLTDIAHNADPSPQDSDHNPGTPPVAPAPDADDTPSADFARQPAGTYDDEMLDAHFVAGDGRVNENIALTAVHQIFHSEHDRLVDDIKGVLTRDTSSAGVLALAQWKLAAGTPDGWNGERLFQAARFINEMEYQHLVFEEFARKVQPAIRPFHVYSPDINGAVQAEFAHAVYRFGHSMLDDEVARVNINGSNNSIPLLKGFLNPPEYFNGGPSGTLTPEEAAGSIIMGSSDQVGNELDEFVNETLRNNLLGLPLDLATLNLTRAREAGVPTLNAVRRQLHAATNDGQLAPYGSWADFGQNIKHPESLINFVAAYGQHPTITEATTVAAKRAAAKAIVDPSAAPATDPALIPADAADFLFGAGAWATAPGAPTSTGVDKVDLWVGGLAEKTNLFGGLLGSTFNYVFQNQLESLQDGDRLYYLARTRGLNLLAQLEGNSFAELIGRNTDGTNSLKADAFATADCRFQLANLAGTPAGYTQFGSTVADDPSTTGKCDESKLLLRKPDGTIQYRSVNAIDPPGINGQGVYNGTAGVDRIWGGSDNDTFWGDQGNDIIEGNGGDDVALGGAGNDIITDLSGADVLKGGPGNDALDAGPDNDIILGGDGSDFTNGGANDNETFGGPGNDFIIAGQGADLGQGDGGDDWIQGGSGQDLLVGDFGAPFFDDPGQTAPGNDVFIGQVGENDYDAEGGDDIMAQNAAIDRNAGAGGFDWAIHQYDTVGADDDMAINNNLIGVPLPVVVNRDRWQETEADSGSAFNDVIRGDDAVPSQVGGAGFTGCDVLDQAGVDRISGLAALLPPLTGALDPVVANSAPGACPLSGPIWGEGNILLGGGGSDTITGRGGNDIIDGDRSLTVRISVRTNPADPATEIGSTDLMERPFQAGNPKTLQQAVFDGSVDPGNLVIVREIKDAPAGDTGVDTAVFAGPRSNYTLSTSGDALTVTQTGPDVVGQKVSDGTDTLRNIEAVQFSDQTIQVRTPDAPTIGTAVAGASSATVEWSAPAPNGGPAVTSYEVVVSSGGSVVRTITGLSGQATSEVVSGLTIGQAYTFAVRALNAFGGGALSAASNEVVPFGLPAAPSGVVGVPGNGSVQLSWTAPDDGGSPIVGYQIQVMVGPDAVRLESSFGTATTMTITGLTNGTAYTFAVQAFNRAGPGDLSAPSAPVTPGGAVPAAPTAVTAVGGNGSAAVSWTAGSSGGSAITGYRIEVRRGTTVVRTDSRSGTATSTTITGLTNGTAYTFRVRAVNASGLGPFSLPSNAVTPAPTVPAAPTGVTAVRGNASAPLSWKAGSNGGSAITGYRIEVRRGTTVVRTDSRTGTATSTTITGLTNGTAYTFRVRAVNAVGLGAFSLPSNAVTPATVPGAPVIGTPTQGAVGGTLTAVANWTAPTSTGGSAILSYRVSALLMAADGVTVVGSPIVQVAGAAARSLSFTLPAGRYRFQVVATNAVGNGAASARSVIVQPR
ncbi:MAG TPA: fibronectin type III domain-containing protein [Intrasporangium sp.]|uniref:fibronectin type III domain-containing protein n=1 Tax=Intrasporangium sp. TaxID=1925024 RepID=UPI002D76A2A5|nr:fibronectin type III domain-containing protein [Intrasporangium sp.]HET7399472.1 fibronectin type III domain-containing protein [Intrasporangium sp.]